MMATSRYRSTISVPFRTNGMFFCTFSSKKNILKSHESTVQNAVLNDSARFTFSGKEKDPETGYHYFGARYYNSDLSLWLSVDPMADKYPSLSPYNYCAWNPMKLVDPDGNAIKSSNKYSRKMINIYLKEQFGKKNPFSFKGDYLTINERKYSKYFNAASEDRKILLSGLKETIELKEEALITVQTNNSSFTFSQPTTIDGESYDSFIEMDLGSTTGASSTIPLKGTSSYPIAINDKGKTQGTSLTTDYKDKNGNPITTTSTASTVFIHEVLDEFLNRTISGNVSSNSPNKEKVYYQNAAQRNIGLLERNGADHDY